MERDQKKVRYAVVGLGYIAQGAILPAFEHSPNSELTALVSGDDLKLEKLGDKYGVPPENRYTYKQYAECLKSGKIDAVFIALPNNMHCQYTVEAANAGIHVLCEKPMAITEEECGRMIEACDRNRVKLMIGYRLHFEEANMRAVEIANSGTLGEVKHFQSLFTQQVQEGNIRLKRALGGGSIYDIGIYCINAARYIFRAEPTEVQCWTMGSSKEKRFREVDQTASVIMKFPGDRMAAFTCSFGCADVSAYQVVGSKGDLRVDPAYEYTGELKHVLTVEEKKTEQIFPARDQFAAEIIYFSDCVTSGRKPEPSGEEGLADVRIIRALYRSAETNRPVKLEPFTKEERPTIEHEKRLPPVKKPELIRAASPSGS